MQIKYNGSSFNTDVAVLETAESITAYPGLVQHNSKIINLIGFATVESLISQWAMKAELWRY